MANAQYDDPMQNLATYRMQQYIREAEIDHLASKMHPRGTSWWLRQTGRPLSFLGHALTNVGERLMATARIPDGSKV